MPRLTKLQPDADAAALVGPELAGPKHKRQKEASTAAEFTTGEEAVDGTAASAPKRTTAPKRTWRKASAAGANDPAAADSMDTAAVTTAAKDHSEVRSMGRSKSKSRSLKC